jgi:hypothetical protein
MNFFTALIERRKNNLHYKQNQTGYHNEASENQSEVEMFKVLADVSSSTGQLQTAGQRKFKEGCCKELQ